MGPLAPALPSIVYRGPLALPTGVARQLPWLAAWPQVARAPSRQVVSTAARCALTPEVVELPAVPPLGQLGVFAPLRPLGLGSLWYFRTPALLRGFPRGVSVCGLGWLSAAPALAGGSTGAALWVVSCLGLF